MFNDSLNYCLGSQFNRTLFWRTCFLVIRGMGWIMLSSSNNCVLTSTARQRYIKVSPTGLTGWNYLYEFNYARVLLNSWLSSWSKDRSLISWEGALELVGGNSLDLPLTHGCYFTRLPPSAHCMLRKIPSQDGQPRWMKLPYRWGCNSVTQQQHPCRLIRPGDQSPLFRIMLSIGSVRLCPARQEISHIHDPCPCFSLTFLSADRSLSIADAVLYPHPRITN